MTLDSRRLATVVVCALLLGGCTSDSPPEDEKDDRVVQLGAPGESNTELSEEELEALGSPGHTDADVAFVQGMIPHHQQALEMTAMVDERTAHEGLPLMAERMEISQTDEIAQMEAWLEERDEDLPAAHGDHEGGHAALMPGMLTEDELAQLEAADGVEFDRLFLQYMIRHHEGAVLMVEGLLTEGGGGQESEVFQLAQHIDSDQRVEIARMRTLLAELG